MCLTLWLWGWTVMLSLCAILGPNGWRKHWALRWTTAREVSVYLRQDTRAREFAWFHLYCLSSCMEVNISYPKSLFACLRMQVCKHVCVQVFDVDHSERARERPAETHIFVSKTSAFIYNYSQNTRTELYVCCKNGRTESALPTCLKRSSLNILGIKQQQLWPEHLREQMNSSPGFSRPVIPHRWDKQFF